MASVRVAPIVKLILAGMVAAGVFNTKKAEAVYNSIDKMLSPLTLKQQEACMDKSIDELVSELKK